MRHILPLLILLATAACATSAPTTARDDRAQTPRETCMKSCDRDMDMCMDESSNGRESLAGLGRLPTAGVGCQNSLKRCQSGCRGL